MFDMLDDGKES